MKLDCKRLPLDGRGGLVEMLRALPDPRHRRGNRHGMTCIVAIAVCAVLSGAQSLGAIAQWAQDQSKATLRRIGNRRDNPPSEPTIRRVLRSIDVQLLDEAVGRWLEQRSVLQGEGVAIDGNVVRGSGDANSKPVHRVSAMLQRDGTVLAQNRVPDKTSEIKRVEPLFEGRDLRGAVVTGDAMFTNKAIAGDMVASTCARSG